MVEFNAWETDFAADPFLALTEEMIEEFGKFEFSNGAKIDRLKSVAAKVLRQVGPELVQSAAESVAGPVAGKTIGNLLEGLAKERMSEYAETKKAKCDFKKTLKEMAHSMQEEGSDGRPLVVVIDELDRCRPTYAIELLETAKHLFSVDGVVFVLGINRTEMEHSVNALYGEDFDGAEYFRRFFDIDFRLPEAERAAFIDAKLSEIQIDTYYQPDQVVLSSSGRGDASELLHDFFGLPDLSLRTVGQALHRLGLILTSLPNDRTFSVLTATFAIILRTLDSDLYHRFARNEATDQEVAVAIFGRMATDYRYSNIGRNMELQILMAASEKQLIRGFELNEIESPLLRKYQELAAANKSSGVEKDSETNHAVTMLSFAKHAQRQGFFRGSTPYLRTA